MSHHDELHRIDPAALDNVTGGVTVPAAPTTRPPNMSPNGGPLQQLMMPMNGGRSAAGGACPCGCGMASCLRR